VGGRRDLACYARGDHKVQLTKKGKAQKNRDGRGNGGRGYKTGGRLEEGGVMIGNVESELRRRVNLGIVESIERGEKHQEHAK